MIDIAREIFDNPRDEDIVIRAAEALFRQKTHNIKFHWRQVCHNAADHELVYEVVLDDEGLEDGQQFLMVARFNENQNLRNAARELSKALFDERAKEFARESFVRLRDELGVTGLAASLIRDVGPTAASEASEWVRSMLAKPPPALSDLAGADGTLGDDAARVLLSSIEDCRARQSTGTSALTSAGLAPFPKAASHSHLLKVMWGAAEILRHRRPGHLLRNKTNV